MNARQFTPRWSAGAIGASGSTAIVHASVGRRRAFLSHADALSYEQGYLSHRSGAPRPEFYGPRMSGWIDAEIEALDALDRGEGFAQ